MNPVFDPLQRKMVSGPEAGQNVDVDGFEVSFTGSSTGGVYNAAAGLSLTGNTFSVAPGYRLNTSSGTVNQDRFFPIETVSGTSVTLQAGHAYIINATTSTGITLNCESFAANAFGLEGHATIYTANAGYVQQGANVYLADPLEPDAVNNCTIRFHGGSAAVSVEDYFGGYIVLSGGTGSGSLPYGLASAGSQYIGFNASLNGQTLDLSGAVANGEKHIVGNGYTSTMLTGAVNCGSSSFTVANLSLDNIQVTGGILTLGDAYIPSGSTVAVSGGGLAVEKVTGNGGTIDLGGTRVAVAPGTTVAASSVTFSGGDASATASENGGAFQIVDGTTSARFDSCAFIRNHANGAGGALYAFNGAIVTVNGCTFQYNTCTNTAHGAAVYVNNASAFFSGCSVLSATTGKPEISLTGGTPYVQLTDCTFEQGRKITFNLEGSGAEIALAGTNVIQSISGSVGKVTISGFATLDLTGNTNPTPIAPGGGITFEAGGATVLYSSGAVSGSYMMDNVTLPAGAKLTNTAVVDLAGSNVVVSSGATASASGCTFTGGGNASNGIIYCDRANVTLSGCTFTSNSPKLGTIQNYTGICSMTGCQITGNQSVDTGVAGYYHRGGTSYLNGCIVSGNVNSTNRAFDIRCNTGDLYLTDTRIGREIMSGGTTHLIGACGADMIEKYSDSLYGSVIISGGASINLTSSIEPGGGIEVLGGITVNTHPVSSGTYTQINADGSTVPPQA